MRHHRRTRLCTIICGLLGIVLLIPSIVFAQVAFRSSASASTHGGSEVTHIGAGRSATRDSCGDIRPAIPGGKEGDFLVALVTARKNSVTVSMPGWNLAYSDTYFGEDFKALIYWRVATGRDPNTISQSGDCSKFGAQIARFSGVDTTKPFENSVIPPGNVVRQRSDHLDTGTETTTIDGSMLLVAGFIKKKEITLTPDAGWNRSFETSDLANEFSISLHYQVQPDAGAASISNWRFSDDNEEDNFGVIFALRPVPSDLSINVPAGTIANDVMIAGITAQPCTMDLKCKLYALSTAAGRMDFG